MIINKTWNDFWGEFLLVEFHKDNPLREELVAVKAEWVWNNANLINGSKVLDLGCGSGLLDIDIAGMGADVTAVDRIESVLNIARNKTSGVRVKFVHNDIRTVNYADRSFNCVLILETLGLLDRDEDINLIRKSFKWLDKNGILIVDSPEPLAAGPNFWKKEFPAGLLTFKTEYDPLSRIETITPFLISGDDTIQLYDKYSSDKGDYTGVKRYLYNKKEIWDIMEMAGFGVSEIPHFWGEKYYALKGVKS